MSREWLCVLLASLSTLLSLLAALFAAARRFRDPALRSLQSSVAALRAGHDEHERILVAQEARDRMRRVRAAARDPSSSSPIPPENPNEKPDPYKDPVAWKRWMREHNPAIGAPAK